MLEIKKGVAVLDVLYEQIPNGEAEPFIEVRRWETTDGQWSELIIEIGQVGDDGELNTSCRVVPYHYELVDIFAMLTAEGVQYRLP